jgi:hypothetical protein
VTGTSLAERVREEIARIERDELRDALAQWVAADKEFNTWFLLTTKRQLDDDELLGLLDGYRETQEIVESAWDSFGKHAGDEASSAILLARIEESLERMRELMNK